jgi:hypothetical protein
MEINLYWIKGVMFGFEMVDTEDYGRNVVFDLGILRIYIEY